MKQPGMGSKAVHLVDNHLMAVDPIPTDAADFCECVKHLVDCFLVASLGCGDNSALVFPCVLMCAVVASADFVKVNHEVVAHVNSHLVKVPADLFSVFLAHHNPVGDRYCDALAGVISVDS
mgnify:CR=1 FL=1